MTVYVLFEAQSINLECLFVFLKHGFRMNLNALDCRMIRFSHAHLSDPLNDAQIYSWVFKMHGKLAIDTLLRNQMNLKCFYKSNDILWEYNMKLYIIIQ